MSQPILVLIAGGTASGKTSFCQCLHQSLGLNCTLLSMDNFYKGISQQEQKMVHQYNFDHPNAIDFDDLFQVVSKLMAGEDVFINKYDFKEHRKSQEVLFLAATPLILYEGIYALYDPRIREISTLKISIQTDDDIRLARRLIRDQKERGRDVDGILNQYFKFVKPSFDEYVLPTLKYADIIVPYIQSNEAAVDLITMKLQQYLKQKIV